MKLTRRELAGAVAGSAALSVVALAQAPPTQSTDYLAASRESHRQNSEVLRKFDLPMSTEPAFAFKA